MTKHQSVDVLSFPWYCNEPGMKRKRFEAAIKPEQPLYRMSHVKSLAKLHSNTALEPLCHNFKATTQGTPFVNQLPGGTVLNHLNTLKDRQILIPNRTALDPSSTEQWFIPHKIYKSEVEHLTSLFRGNRQSNIDLPLKINRWGYIIGDQATKGFSLRYSQREFSAYTRRRKSFLSEHDLRG